MSRMDLSYKTIKYNALLHTMFRLRIYDCKFKLNYDICWIVCV